jgi:transglutaminase-like putative cysteine protease
LKFRLALLVFLGFGVTASAGSGSVKSGTPQHASFVVQNVLTVKVPQGARHVRIWFAVPQENTYTKVTGFTATAPYHVEYRNDSWGNREGYIDVTGAKQTEITITEHFDVRRTEILNHLDPSKTRPLTDAERKALQRYLLPTTYVIINPEIKKLSEQIVGGETNPILASRKIYDWTLNNISYWVEYPDRMHASKTGSTEFCLGTKSGNCTDFHSLYASLSMAAGIPTRMVYGSLLKPTLDGVPVDASYHCWIQFYAPNYGWIPLDVALADIYGKEFPLTDKNKSLVELTTATGYHGFDKSKIDFYFGNLDDRRVVWSTGRDLMMQPPQDDGPVNAMVEMYAEVDGETYTDWTRKFTYKQLSK